jgi:hypothetical protein
MEKIQEDKGDSSLQLLIMITRIGVIFSVNILAKIGTIARFSDKLTTYTELAPRVI